MTLALPLTPLETGRAQVSQHWCITRDGDPQALALFVRHYSCHRPARKWNGGNYARFTGPGHSLVLISTDGQAIFAWRTERFRLDGQTGVQCAVFRNEGQVLSSDLVREASALAWQRWPGERLYTYVNPRRIQSSNPGYCFQLAGWQKTAARSTRGLIILEALPLASPVSHG